MKIAIDTQSDSKEEIKKAIKLLMSLVEEKVYTNDQKSANLFEPATNPEQNIFSIFDQKTKEEKLHGEAKIELY